MVRHAHARPDSNANERKEIWVAMVKGMIKSVGETNEELTIALEKICQAKKVPRRWIKLNKPKFMGFLKYLRYKIDAKVSEQLWDMFSKALEVQRAKEEKKKIAKPVTKTATEEEMETSQTS